MLEKTLESPLDCKEIKSVILKEISPECTLEGLMLKLNTLAPDAKDSLEKTPLLLGKTKDRRRQG